MPCLPYSKKILSNFSYKTTYNEAHDIHYSARRYSLPNDGMIKKNNLISLQ